jgi:nucleotide-binding universal stress UspA family protein
VSDNKRVVVGVDGSSDGEKAVQWAAEFADLTGADLLLVTASEWPSTYGAPVNWPDFRPDEDARTVAEKAKASLNRTKGGAEIAICEGRPGKVLVDRAEYAAALVVGSRGHGAVAEALLGSVSAYCVRHADCPVVVVR